MTQLTVDQNINKLLRKVHFLENLPGLEYLEDACKEVSLKPEEMLFREGDPGDAMYIILTGSLKVFKKQKVIACRYAGEYVGEMALLGNNYRSASIKALTDTKLLKINHQDFYRYLASNPATLMTLLKTMAIRSKEDLEILDSDYQQLVDQRKIARRFKRILDDATNDIFILDPKKYGIVDTNLKAGQTTGYSPEILENLKLYDLFADISKEEFLNKIQPLKSRTQSLISFEVQIKRQDKSLYPVEAQLQFLDMEKPPLLLAVFMDISERKRAENELHRLEKAIEQNNEIITITDIDGNTQYVNLAFEKITGYKKEEIIGQNLRILKSGKQDKLFYKKMWDTLKQGKVWSGHFINKKKDGTLFEEEASISPLFDNSGIITNFVAVKRDVTKEVMLKSQVRQSQKLEAVGTLAGGIAHELNNILMTIIGYTKMSIGRMREDSKTCDYMNRVLKSSERARDIIKQILTFSCEIETELKPLELRSVVKEVLKPIKSSLPATIKIRSNIDKETGIIVANLTQIQQLIMNLCVNAEYAMREKGGILEINLDSVNVDAELASIHTNLKEGPYIKLIVMDTGHGMDKKVAERVFDPFFTTKETGEGTGMGLTIVHGIVSNHGGTIAVNSEPGKGTTFEVYLPKADTIIKNED